MAEVDICSSDVELQMCMFQILHESTPQVSFGYDFIELELC